MDELEKEKDAIIVLGVFWGMMVLSDRQNKLFKAWVEATPIERWEVKLWGALTVIGLILFVLYLKWYTTIYVAVVLGSASSTLLMLHSQKNFTSMETGGEHKNEPVPTC